MKFKLLVMLAVSMPAFAQDTIPVIIDISPQTHSQIFALSPISKRIHKVNGFVFGVGHVENKNIENQKINGFNLEANPAPIAGVFVAFIALMHLPDVLKNGSHRDFTENIEDNYKIRNLDHTPHLKINGLNVSSGCFFTTTSMNGLNISVGNKFNDFNGLSITALGTIADTQNGISIGIYNANNTLTGSTIGILNQSYDLNGLQIGCYNYTRHNRGIQLGFFNRSNSKGMQIGLWNINNKRSMPFLNW